MNLQCISLKSRARRNYCKRTETRQYIGTETGRKPEKPKLATCTCVISRLYVRSGVGGKSDFSEPLSPCAPWNVTRRNARWKLRGIGSRAIASSVLLQGTTFTLHRRGMRQNSTSLAPESLRIMSGVFIRL